MPIPELLAIVAGAVLLWYLLGPVVAGVPVATIALSSGSLSLLFERDDEPSRRRRLALVVPRLRWPLILLVIGLAVAAGFQLQRLSGLPEFRTYVVLYVFACAVGASPSSGACWRPASGRRPR